MIGTTVGNYRVLEKLGDGGMGSVYKAVDVNLGREVALKFLHANLQGSPELLERFREEARTQSTLSHPNVAILFALEMSEGRAVMVMEYIEGETLEARIEREGAMPIARSVPLFKQALQGVGAAHRRGIVHRDLKPANLMVDRSEVVKVMDFGIAKVQGHHGLTRPNTTMGTPWYMAPEQVLGTPVDARTDVYSMGVTLFELLTGKVPFDGSTEFEVQRAHVQTPPPSPEQLRADIPPHLVNATLRALEKDPAQRFQTADEFLQALNVPEPPAHRFTQPMTPAPVGRATVPERPAMHLNTPPPANLHKTVPSAPLQPPLRPPLPPTVPRPAAASQKGYLAAALLVLLLAAGVGGWAIFGRHKSTPADDTTKLQNGSSGSTGGSSQGHDFQTASMNEGNAAKTPTSSAPNSGTGVATNSGTVQPKLKVAAVQPDKQPIPVPTKPVPRPAAALPPGQELSGIWTGAFAEPDMSGAVAVQMHLEEKSPTDISGTLQYTTASNAVGICQLAQSSFNEASGTLLLKTVGCSGTEKPSFLNFPTEFDHVNPSGSQLLGGHTTVVKNSMVATLRRH